MTDIGILHPGDMGISVAASAIRSGHQLFWASEGRSQATRARAEKHHLVDTGSLSELCRRCQVILCVCPPHAAEDVARSVASHGFKGIYLDANAISPQRALKIEKILVSADIRFVDGGIVGGPAWKPHTTRLYVSGTEAEQIAEYFSAGPLEAQIIGDQTGKASALKMCYAAYSKGTTALLAATLATAESLGVRAELNREWDLDNDGFSADVNRRVQRVTAKAWRFEGEMREIAGTFKSASLPDEFHQAAAEIYHRLADFKGRERIPKLDEVLGALLQSPRLADKKDSRDL